MKTIAIVGQKGGAGETTLTLHLACAAQAGGFQGGHNPIAIPVDSASHALTLSKALSPQDAPGANHQRFDGANPIL